MDFIIDFLIKAGPATNALLGVLLLFIFRAIAANTEAITKQSDAMVTMSSAMDKLGDALLAVAKNQERAGDAQSELIRMMESFRAVGAERHHTIANALQSFSSLLTQFLTTGPHRGSRT